MYDELRKLLIGQGLEAVLARVAEICADEATTQRLQADKQESAAVMRFHRSQQHDWERKARIAAEASAKLRTRTVL